MTVLPPPTLKAIPAALRNRPQWVVWKFETREGRETKAPYQAREPFKRASSTQPGTWATFDEAVHCLELHADDAVAPVAGLGFVFTRDDPFCGCDIDPDLDDAAQLDIIARLASYTERSPSGMGYHVIIRARSLEKGRHPPGIGVFTEGRYFTVTGDHVVGTPDTIEDRQPELEAIMDEYLPVVALPNAYGNGNGVHPVDLEDEALIQKARDSRKGADFSDLMAGRWEGKYSSQSEADLALCSKLAFWTGRVPERMDRIFRSSGLMREKWERDDYRERTLGEAIAGCRDVYVLKRERSQPFDELHDVPADEAPPPDTAPLQLKIVTLEQFAAEKEEGAEPLMGVVGENLALPAGGTMLLFGDGGAGKTTMELDILCHLAAGVPWQGLAVNRRIRTLIIENEGPRSMFRQKIDAKLQAWEGPALEGNIVIPEQPWGTFTFAAEEYREQIKLAVLAYDVDIVACGPVTSLGIKGGGTPEEVATFVYQLELVRAQLERPLAYIMVHHENKAGDVSGHWRGTPDTLLHAWENGEGSTRIVWEKVRWGSKLQRQQWQLNWRSGETFARAEEREKTDSEYRSEMLAFVGEHPLTTWRAVRDELGGDPGKVAGIRDALLKSGEIVNKGTANRFELVRGEGQDGLFS